MDDFGAADPNPRVPRQGTAAHAPRPSRSTGRPKRTPFSSVRRKSLSEALTTSRPDAFSMFLTQRLAWTCAPGREREVDAWDSRAGCCFRRRHVFATGCTPMSCADTTGMGGQAPRVAHPAASAQAHTPQGKWDGLGRVGHLGVDHQRPAPRLGHDDCVFYADAVGGQARNGPGAGADGIRQAPAAHMAADHVHTSQRAGSGPCRRSCMRIKVHATCRGNTSCTMPARAASMEPLQPSEGEAVANHAGGQKTIADDAPEPSSSRSTRQCACHRPVPAACRT